MLKVENLSAKIKGKSILKNLDFEVKPGEVHAIMGPNGAGKSTLSQVIAGREDYEVTSGDILFKNKSILDLEPEERAREGIFIAFQYPVEVPGVNNIYFLRAAYNAIRKHKGEPEADAVEFLKIVKRKMKEIQMNPQFMNRSVNEGFSGGEKKRNEILQLSILDPSLAILDETDSGLDIDALRIVSEGVNRYKNEKNAVVVITHYQRLLDYIVPDYVHVLADGKIIKSGDKSLALELEEKGYDWLFQPA